MNDIVNIIKEIIQNNVDDLPLNETVVNDKIVLDRKNKIYKKVSSINIPKHNIILSRVTNEHFRGRFIFEKKVAINQTYFLKYKNEIVPLNEKDFQILNNLWYNKTHNKKWENDTTNIVFNTI